MQVDIQPRLLKAEDCEPGKFVWKANEGIFGIKMKAKESTVFLMFYEHPTATLVSSLDKFLQFDGAVLRPDYTRAIHTHKVVSHLPFGSLIVPEGTGQPAWLATKQEYYVLVNVKDGQLASEPSLLGVYLPSWKVVLPSRDNEVLFEFEAELPDQSLA